VTATTAAPSRNLARWQVINVVLLIVRRRIPGKWGEAALGPKAAHAGFG